MANQVMLVKDQYRDKRYDLQRELRNRGIAKKCKKVEDLPEDLREYFEMVTPSFYV